MPKLPRVTGKIFAGNASEEDLGQFGSALSGTKITNNDISVLQELPAYEEGWRGAVISNRNYPTLQEMNSVQRIASQQIAYTLQNGMPEWDENTTYYTNQFCRVGKDFYCSKIDDNTGNNPVLATDEWELWSGGGGTGGASRNIGETVFSLLPLEDAGLHLLDGSLIEGLGSYRAFVQYIASLYGTGETHPSYFVTEEEYQTSITKYGVCGKFVYDSTANTVRLPKVTGIVEGTLDVTALGDLVQAGLPALKISATTNSTGAHTHTRGTMNITGNASQLVGAQVNANASGAFSYTASSNNNVGTSGSNYYAYKTLSFNASNNWTGATASNGAHTHTVTVNNNSSTLFGNSDTVQPQTIKGFMYLVIANAAKTEIEVDIDNVMTDLNGKADVDLGNLNEVGESHFDSKYLGNNQRTNCLLEVPQRINYTLENGTFTLKAGSVIIVPFGTEAPALAIGDFLEGASNNNNFKIVDIQYKNNQLFYWCEVQNDITQTVAATGSTIRFIAVTISGTNLEQWITWNTYTSSAATLPSDTQSYMWYQPDNNKVVHTNSSHTPDRTLSLPIVKVQAGNSTVFNTVLQVFNGMGNIGGINWVDKGVKGLIPYYRNEDRTLKSISFAQTELTLSLNRSSNTVASQKPLLGNYQEDTGCIVPYQMLSNNYYYESDVQPNVTNQYAIWYDTYNNILKETSDTGQTWTEKISLKIGHGTIDDGVLNSSYQTVFQAADAQNIPGQWVNLSYTIANSVPVTSVYPGATYDLSSVLPNDGNVYECIFSGIATTDKAAINNYVNIHLVTDIIQSNCTIAEARTMVVNYQNWAGGCVILPVGSGRFVKVNGLAGATSKGSYELYLRGYRKVRG